MCELRGGMGMKGRRMRRRLARAARHSITNCSMTTARPQAMRPTLSMA